MFESPGNVAINIGTLNIYWYGIIIAISVLSGIFITLKVAKQASENQNTINHIYNLATISIITGIVFARLYYVLFNWDYFYCHPLEILMTWKGGMSIHGTILGSLVVFFLYTKINKLSFLKFTDLFAYGMIFAQSIGRWGNFFNSEAFGSPTNLPWKLFIPWHSRPMDYIQYEYFHPTFLYESIWNIFVFLILFFFIRPKKYIQKGTITFLYLILYSLGRFFIEELRLDNVYSIFGLHLAQIISIVLFLAGIFFLCKLYKKEIFKPRS